MSKPVKVVLYAVGVLLILALIAQLFLTFWADDYVATRLKKTVYEQSDRVYEIDFDDLSLNLFTGSLTISDMRISADTIRLGTVATPTRRPPSALVDGTIGEISLSGLSVWDAYRGRRLHTDGLYIKSPRLHLYLNDAEIPTDSTQTPFQSVDSTLYAAISKSYSALSVDTFALENAAGLLTQGRDTLSTVDDLNITLHNIRVDSISAASGRRFITNDIELQVGQLAKYVPNELNALSVRGLRISADEQIIQVDSLQLSPRLPRFEFSRRKGTEIDRINLLVPSLKIEEVNLNQFIARGPFTAHRMTVDAPSFRDFRNKEVEFPLKNDPPIPHMALKRLPQQLKIDSVYINQAFISYSEFWKPAPKAGTITFEKVNATIANVTNLPADIDSGAVIRMDATTMVMGKARLDAHFQFPMDTKNGFHKVQGHLAGTPLSIFNPILEYVAFIRVDKGMLNSLDFDMSLNEISSNGTLVMNYEDLKISVLDKKSTQQRGILENLKTLVANNIIIKKNNTPEGGMRAGPIAFDRIQRKSVFNYWWKSLLSGIKPSIGG